MANYDTSTLTMSSMTTNPGGMMRLSTSDLSLEMLNENMDPFAHGNFGGDVLLLDDVNTSNLPSLPFTPSFDIDTFSGGFDDPFSYLSTMIEDTNSKIIPKHENVMEQSAELDNKLLGFGAVLFKSPTLDDIGQTWPVMSAELYGMFFVAEDVFGENSTQIGRPVELTCYRRNLFQINGSITLSRGIKSIISEQGQQIPIYDLAATISALESNEGKNTEIIAIPWKTATAGATSEERAGTAPARLPLDLTANPGVDPALVTVPIAWKRLQFKHATANNGRRKGLQQHYTIQINIIATLATGESVKLAEIQSGPIIVRGRSPRNFDSRKDVPLTEKSEKKAEVKQRSTSDESATPKPLSVDPGVDNGSYRFYALNALQQPLDLPDWANTPLAPTPSADSHSRQAKRATLPHQSSNSMRPPAPLARWNSEATPHKSFQASAPTDLSLADDGHRSSDVGITSPSMSRDRDKVGIKGMGSPVESADMLYEYFPLSVDDWMPPVDAIYRPHVVHHTVMPADLKAAQVKNKTKRYFSADD